MSASGSGTTEGDRRWFDGEVGLATLGLVYVVVGVGLFVGLVTDSIEVVAAALVGVVGSMAVSLYVVVRREGLVTAENGIIGASVLVAMGLLVVLPAVPGIPSSAVFGVVFTVGVVVPHLLLEYTDYGRSS